MLKLVEPSEFQQFTGNIRVNIDNVCRLIPPMWDLRNFVAVNPFLGFSSKNVVETAKYLEDHLDARVLPGFDFYRERWKRGDFGPIELNDACQRHRYDAKMLQAMLSEQNNGPHRTTEAILSFAERYDTQHGTDWNDILIRFATKWCAVYAAKGGRFGQVVDHKSLFESWREATLSDRTLEFAGLKEFRDWLSKIPDTAEEAIQHLLGRLPIQLSQQESYLYRLLGGVYGWSSYFRRLAWEVSPEQTGSVRDLLAIRICLDAAIIELKGASFPVKNEPKIKVKEDEFARYVLQEALETAYSKRLAAEIRLPESSDATPAFQAVFCIDVRSEPLRRHLEAQSPEIQTRGFAGFFGVALNWKTGQEDSPRCPVLLKPGIILEKKTNPTTDAVGALLSHVQGAPGAAFSFVETLGLAYGLRMSANHVAEEVAKTKSEGIADFELTKSQSGLGIATEERVNLAAGILKNMGFKNRFAKLVLLCGHEGHSANNAHAAGLDCGACGGHGGAINARVAAAVLNDPVVRIGLSNLGWEIPHSTHFLPGVHDTSTDEVRLLDIDKAPADHHDKIRTLTEHLNKAGQMVRAERATHLGLSEKPAGLLAKLLKRRAKDWSEVRPEWALARNAAFIAARRQRTRGIHLHGRVFLHDYDASADPDDSILTLIMAAPMVVASWINLQYLASTVDNDKFGSGDKAIHHRVGSHGVVLGNGGDLRTGLPLQSVHSAEGKWFHDPLRLQVILESPTDKIDRVLKARADVRQLIENGWVKLFALSPEANEISRLVPGSGWEKM